RRHSPPPSTRFRAVPPAPLRPPRPGCAPIPYSPSEAERELNAGFRAHSGSRRHTVRHGLPDLRLRVHVADYPRPFLGISGVRGSGRAVLVARLAALDHGPDV